MPATAWLDDSRIRLDEPVEDLDGVLAVAADLLAPEAGLPPATVQAALTEACAHGAFTVSEGVAVPHAGLPEVPRPTVAFVRPRRPLDVGAPDDVPVDLFFVEVARRGAPQLHLRTLAHIARLAQSRPLMDGLRRAESAADVIRLLEESEAPVAPPRPAAGGVEARARRLLIIQVKGEQAADRLFVDLVAAGLGDNAIVVEAVSVREAAAREVPLFAGFRDLFGDPGGRRIILVETEATRVDGLVATVKRACERRAEEVRVVLLPVELGWSSREARSPSGQGT